MSNGWNVDRKIGFAALVVSIISTVVAIFPREIHDYLLSLNAAIIGILVALVGIYFATRLPTEFHKGWLLSALVSAALLGGFAVGVVWHRSREVAPFVLMGSSNVKNYLTEKITLDQMQPLWLDVGSGEGLSVLFYAFEYGTYTSAGNKRQALVAVSSYGTGHLEELFKHADPSKRINNYWLSITVAEPPLLMLYREPSAPKTPNNTLMVPKTSASTTANYWYVKCAEIKRVFESKTAGGIKRYVPEAGMGTRAAFEAACKKIAWPDSAGADMSNYPKQCVEDFTGPFIDLVSWAPVSCTTKRTATCTELKERNIKAAAVCDNCTNLAGLPRAEHVVVMKLTPDLQGHFKITNGVECKIAEKLTPKVTHCELSAQVPIDPYNIARIDSQVLDRTSIPDLLNCP